MTRHGWLADAASWLAVFEHLPLGAIVHQDGIIQASNAGCRDLLGYAPDEMVGRSMYDFLDEASRDEVASHQSEDDHAAYRVVARAQDGRDVPLHIDVRPMDLESGRARIVLMRSLDAEDAQMDQIRGDLAQKEELRRLKETSRFKTQILNTTAHELNTPLTPVRLQLHLMKTGALGALPPRHAKAISIIDRNIERLSFLVNDILDVARLESGRLEVHRQPARLESILADSMESFEETARRVGVQLRLETGSSTVVDADPARITQVVDNLVGNALKFTPEGGKVLLRTRTEGGHAILDVQDTGPGLTPDQIGRLFEPFSRVHDTQNSTIAGTGLGLYICKGLMDAHDGEVQVHSDGPGKGTTFSIRIPLSSEALPVQPRRSAPPRPADALAQRLRELI